jgi:Fe-S cluster assembly ATP-binding protein
MLNIQNFSVSREGKLILNDINLSIKPGEIHALMGPNGSGKSTLASSLIGHPDLTVDAKSKVMLDDINLLDLDISDRVKKGLFLAFQYPVEVSGVPYVEFLRLSYNEVNKGRNPDFKELSPFKFKQLIIEHMKTLKMNEEFLKRNLNEGFSGGEKKKSEILQMTLLAPKYAILDETDSGLDVSALKIVATNSNILAKKNNIGLLVITHYQRILEYMDVDKVHVLVKGKIVESGGPSLAEKLDKEGYDKYLV